MLLCWIGSDGLLESVNYDIARHRRGKVSIIGFFPDDRNADFSIVEDSPTLSPTPIFRLLTMTLFPTSPSQQPRVLSASSVVHAESLRRYRSCKMAALNHIK
jgi:hypothetical protein